MRKDPTEWRNGFDHWRKTGELPWDAGKRKELPKFRGGKESYNIKRVYAPYYDSDGTLIRNVDSELPELVVTGRKSDYTKIAEQERSRQRLMAKLYAKSTPSIGNLYNTVNSFIKSLPIIGVTAAEMNPYILTGIAPSPMSRTPREILKEAPNIGLIYRQSSLLNNVQNNPIANAYNKIKTFLESPAYRLRLIKYYRDKGSSIVTQNYAPEDRIGEQLYNIETAHIESVPHGRITDIDGTVFPESVRGLYEPETHTIQVANTAITKDVPVHEMFHARNLGKPYLDNAKYKMRTKYDFVNDVAKTQYVESMTPQQVADMRHWQHYYSDIVEQEPRVLNTAEAMRKEGYDINNVSDEDVFDFLFNRPIETHGSDTQSLIDNYVAEDIPNAIRNMKNIFLPIGFGTIGYGLYNKYAE